MIIKDNRLRLRGYNDYVTPDMFVQAQDFDSDDEVDALDQISSRAIAQSRGASTAAPTFTAPRVAAGLGLSALAWLLFL